MSDILLQNAVREIGESLQSSESMPENLNPINITKLKTAIISSVTALLGGYNTLTGNAIEAGFTENSVSNICTLSCNQLMANCNHNVRGNGTTNPSPIDIDSSWSSGDFYTPKSTLVSLAGTTEYEISSAITLLLNLTGMETYKRLYANVITEDIPSIRLTIASLLLTELNRLDVDLTKFIEFYRTSDLTEGADGGNSLKVCGASWKTGEGKSQQWVVPAGASRAKFQVWGAGSGTGSACCCGGNQFGANGAFAQVIMDVSPGETYTLCAGCSCSRYCCSDSGGGFACMSGVTGPGISTLKADGGCWNNCEAMHCLRTLNGAGAICYRFQNPYCTTSGPCYCGCGEYCFGCSTCGVVPIYADCTTGRCFLATIDSSRNPNDAGGMRPLHGGGCLDTNNYGWHSRPPVLDSDECQWFSPGCQIHTFTSENCTGGCLYKDHTYHPGHGGASAHVMSGSNTHIGDTGRGGLVKVEWK